MIDNVKATLPAVMGDAVMRQNRATCWGFSEVMRATNPNLGGQDGGPEVPARTRRPIVHI